MKKLIVFMMIVLMVSLTYFVKNDYNPLFAYAGTTKVCLVVKDGALSEGEIVDSGNVDFVYLSKEAGLNAVSKVSVEGLEFYLSGAIQEEILALLKASVIKESTIDNINLVYAYTPYYQDSIIMEGKKVNLQLALYGEEIIAGFPIILTGY